MAWWLVPLLAKHAYSVDYGTDWQVDLSSFPIYTWIALAVGAVFCLREWRLDCRPAACYLVMCVIALLLFFYSRAMAKRGVLS